MTADLSPSPRIARLAALAALPERRVLGLMSGTSMDGLDLALCRIAGRGGDTSLALEHHATVAYTPALREELAAVVSRPTVSLADLTVLHGRLATLHGAMVLETLAGWGVDPAQVHLLASHGQTVWHAPDVPAPGEPRESAPKDTVDGILAPRHATLQIGDGDLLAVRTGLLTLSDFRQKEIAHGGQGAPLAPYGEALLFAGEQPRILLNLGGIANFTRLPPKGSGAPILTGDTGPANGLLDRALRRFFPDHPDGFDRGGILAAQGRVHAPLLERMKAHPYFARPCPKSTGPELFGEAFLDGALTGTAGAAPSPEDLLATLARLTVETVAETLHRECARAGLPLEGCEGFISGGGRHHPALRDGIMAALGEVDWRDAEALGIDPDAKEAVLFAALAHESLFGAGFPAPAGNTRFGFGKLSWPD